MKFYLVKWVFTLSLLPFFNTFSQVVNDDIDNRIRLSINQKITSKTDDCTVQPGCINTEITGKCIKYHNDQWFEFSVDEERPYFINISNQSCRDVLGVQLVVIKGQPCMPETYFPVACVSLANQDNIYVKLDSLEPKTNYLLVVDGYLKDYCQFDLEISNQPKGKPAKVEIDNNSLTFELNQQFVNATFYVDESKSLNYLNYQILRREANQKKSVKIKQINHEKNAYGKSILMYQFTDTLSKTGKYNYEIYVIKNNLEKDRVSFFNIDFDEKLVKEKYTNHYLTISKIYKKSTALEILITDAITEKVIVSDFRAASRDHQLFYNIKSALDVGTEKIKVHIKDVRKNKTETYIVDWSIYLKK